MNTSTQIGRGGERDRDREKERSERASEREGERERERESCLLYTSDAADDC